MFSVRPCFSSVELTDVVHVNILSIYFIAYFMYSFCIKIEVAHAILCKTGNIWFLSLNYCCQIIWIILDIAGERWREKREQERAREEEVISSAHTRIDHVHVLPAIASGYTSPRT